MLKYGFAHRALFEHKMQSMTITLQLPVGYYTGYSNVVDEASLLPKWGWKVAYTAGTAVE